MPSVDVGIVEQFLHPPLGLLRLSYVAAGPYGAGTHVLTRPAGPVGVDAFGLVVSVVTERVGVGLVYGTVTRFDDRVAQIVVHHTFLDGTPVVTQLVEMFTDAELVMFTRALPTDVTVFVSVGFAVDFYWALLL